MEKRFLDIFRKVIYSLSIIFVALGCTEKESETYTVPTVSTGSNTIYEESLSVTCYGNVINNGGTVVTDRGICYMSGNGTPTISNDKVSGGSGNGEFSCSFDLPNDGTYSYRAYAINSEGTAYGETKTFTINSSQSTSVKVTFGNDVWYDDTPSLTYTETYTNGNPYRWFHLILFDNSITKSASVCICPCYEEVISGSIEPTPAILHHAGGEPVYNIQSNHYSGPTYQFDPPYGDNDFHEYFYISISAYYDSEDEYWIAKNFSVNVIDINTTEKTCSIAVNATLLVRADYNADYTTSYISSAPTRTLKIEAYNIPYKEH